jgi:protocatechuate 3,4-dioxygenase beta subunit
VTTNTSTADSDPGAIQAGVPLALTINVLDADNGCVALNDAVVDIWHCNGGGVYSDIANQQAGGGTTVTDTVGQNYLRGYQITGTDPATGGKTVDGQVVFSTIWPGWYTSRAIHIHVRVREVHSSGATIAGYTTQIFFSDADNDRIFTDAAPYDTRNPKDDATTDENDTVLTKADFATNIVAVKGSIAKGFSATFDIGVTPSQVKTTGTLARPSSGGTGGGTAPGGSGGRPTAPPAS